MKEKQNLDKNCFALLKASTTTLFQHQEILKPFIILIFIQLFILEILYFAPRFPLNIFFGPIIAKLWSESFLHYPLNFALLPKLFQYSQFPVYIFISSLLVSIAILTISNLNNGEETELKLVFKQTLKHYVHIVVATLISFFLVVGLFKIYGLAYERAELIRSKTGIFFILKTIVIYGTPYFNLLLSILVTTLFAYVLPIILIEKEKIFQALVLNFKLIAKSFWSVFMIVFIPSLIYVPVLLLRNSVALEKILPELSVLMLILTIITMVFIDSIVYTAITTMYLLKKESK